MTDAAVRNAGGATTNQIGKDAESGYPYSTIKDADFTTNMVFVLYGTDTFNVAMTGSLLYILLNFENAVQSVQRKREGYGTVNRRLVDGRNPGCVMII